MRSLIAEGRSEAHARTAPTRRRRGGWLAAHLSAAVLGIMAGALVVELALRIAGVSDPYFYVLDPHTGIALRPGVEGWYRDEGMAYVRISRQGLRDREHAERHDPNAFRIAILGDSFAEARQVPAEQAFWSVMQRRLRVCAALEGKVAEAINFGVNGYGTAQELLTLRHRLWPYHPDLVILAVFTGNDIKNNSRALERDPLRPYFVYAGGGLALDMSFLDSRDYRMRSARIARLWYSVANRVRILQVAARAVRTLGADPDAAIAGKASVGDSGLAPAVYREPRDPVWRDAWTVTERLIAAMHDEVERHGAMFLVVTLSNPIQVHPDPAVRGRFMRAVGVKTLLYPDRRIRKLGRREHITVLTLAPRLRAYAETNRTLLHGFANGTPGEGHWNRVGHRVAGSLIARHVCRAARLAGR